MHPRRRLWGPSFAPYPFTRPLRFYPELCLFLAKTCFLSPCLRQDICLVKQKIANMDKLNKKILETRLGCKTAREMAKKLDVAEYTYSRSIDTLAIKVKLLALADTMGVDISDILRAEEQGQSIGYTAPPRPESNAVAHQPEKGYDPHGGWKPRTMSEEWRLAGMAVEVLASRTIYAEALKQNIKAFYETCRIRRRGGKTRRQKVARCVATPEKHLRAGGKVAAARRPRNVDGYGRRHDLLRPGVRRIPGRHPTRATVRKKYPRPP